MHETQKTDPAVNRLCTLMRVYRAAVKANDTELRQAALIELEKFGIQRGDLSHETTARRKRQSSEAKQ